MSGVSFNARTTSTFAGVPLVGATGLTGNLVQAETITGDVLGSMPVSLSGPNLAEIQAQGHVIFNPTQIGNLDTVLGPAIQGTDLADQLKGLQGPQLLAGPQHLAEALTTGTPIQKIDDLTITAIGLPTTILPGETPVTQSA